MRRVPERKLLPEDWIASRAFRPLSTGATIVEASGSHAIYVSKPEAVAKIIEQAAQGRK